MPQRVLVLAAALSIGLVAQAHAARPYSPSMSCAALQGMMAARGAVVISTSRTTFDRYVTDSRFCERDEVTKADWIRSSDRPSCFIGYTCEQYMRDDPW